MPRKRILKKKTERTRTPQVMNNDTWQALYEVFRQTRNVRYSASSVGVSYQVAQTYIDEGHPAFYGGRSIREIVEDDDHAILQSRRIAVAAMENAALDATGHMLTQQVTQIKDADLKLRGEKDKTTGRLSIDVVEQNRAIRALKNTLEIAQGTTGTRSRGDSQATMQPRMGDTNVQVNVLNATQFQGPKDIGHTGVIPTTPRTDFEKLLKFQQQHSVVMSKVGTAEHKQLVAHVEEAVQRSSEIRNAKSSQVS